MHVLLLAVLKISPKLKAFLIGATALVATCLLVLGTISVMKSGDNSDVDDLSGSSITPSQSANRSLFESDTPLDDKEKEKFTKLFRLKDRALDTPQQYGSSYVEDILSSPEKVVALRFEGKNTQWLVDPLPVTEKTIRCILGEEQSGWSLQEMQIRQELIEMLVDEDLKQISLTWPNGTAEALYETNPEFTMTFKPIPKDADIEERLSKVEEVISQWAKGKPATYNEATDPNLPEPVVDKQVQGTPTPVVDKQVQVTATPEEETLVSPVLETTEEESPASAQEADASLSSAGVIDQYLTDVSLSDEKTEYAQEAEVSSDEEKADPEVTFEELPDEESAAPGLTDEYVADKEETDTSSADNEDGESHACSIVSCIIVGAVGLATLATHAWTYFVV